ncbi:MAG: prepilin-type N-terminal cleavage/methylation domain-containing protein [Planctomycetes bacterium]|nr:prepilin-type N-terminal cleavage/methylation domain-containing protein [Planctomycetota bacterium]
MKRPVLVRFRRTGFTLVEILVATTLALLLMGAVAVMFGRVAEGITDSRSMLEAADRLRLAETRLQMDLAGITATVCPPLKPENNEGYFEYIEGPALTNSGIAVNSDTGGTDTTVGDFDDILMFTTRTTTGKPFIGRFGITTIQSDVAEVAWFLRGRTLHRRVLLVAPNVTIPPPPGTTNYYANYDISARALYDAGGTIIGYAPNTLGDLTRRECRFAHPATFPCDVRLWQWTVGTTEFPTLPTLWECSSTGWSTEQLPPPPPPHPVSALDLWTNADGYRLPDNQFILDATRNRVSDDVILTNVIGFDVKAWDPLQNDYVDLGYDELSSLRGLNHPGQTITGSDTTARVYDTWSTTNYHPNWNNGIDDNTDGIVDDDAEKLYPPPYPIPLRGIQVKIRVFEPDSCQVREVTVVQDFLPR